MAQGSALARIQAIAFVAAFVAGLVTSAASVARADDGSRVGAEPAISHLLSMRTVDMRSVPRERIASWPVRPHSMPLLVGAAPATWVARKAAARVNPFAPYDPRPWSASVTPFSANVAPTAKFNGMSNSASICPYYGGCQPPDQAIAASTSWVLQGVNTSFAVYSTSGVVQSGWPKTAQAFFNVPNPGSCDPNGPYMGDPRAFYDPGDGRFWVAALQVEGAFGFNLCQEQSVYWVAVSKTSDPNGAWNVYSFDMRAGSTNAADFTQIGLDAQAFYFGGNMFDKHGTKFLYDEIFAASKSAMELGTPVIALGLKKITVGSTMIDTLQPVLVEGASPAAGLFIASLNINSGNGNCEAGCSGINVFAMANPLVLPTLTHRRASSTTYTLAPFADERGCAACIETFDTRISATPVFSGGVISFALETGVGSGSSVVPGIFWGQVKPTLTLGAITNVAMTQSGVLSFNGGQAASFGALMPDAANDLIIVFDTMSLSLNPGIEYAARGHADPPGTFQAPFFLKRGADPTIDSRWGDYSATSYDGAANDIWVAAEYPGVGGDWSTYIAATHF